MINITTESNEHRGAFYLCEHDHTRQQRLVGTTINHQLTTMR